MIILLFVLLLISTAFATIISIDYIRGLKIFTYRNTIFLSVGFIMLPIVLFFVNTAYSIRKQKKERTLRQQKDERKQKETTFNNLEITQAFHSIQPYNVLTHNAPQKEISSEKYWTKCDATVDKHCHHPTEREKDIARMKWALQEPLDKWIPDNLPIQTVKPNMDDVKNAFLPNQEAFKTGHIVTLRNGDIYKMICNESGWYLYNNDTQINQYTKYLTHQTDSTLDIMKIKNNYTTMFTQLHDYKYALRFELETLSQFAQLKQMTIPEFILRMLHVKGGF